MSLNKELIYGLVPKITTLKLSTYPDEVMDIKMDTESELDNLFDTFIIYILSKGGYDLIRLKSENKLTSQFSKENWIENSSLCLFDVHSAYDRFLKEKLEGEVPAPNFEKNGETLRVQSVRGTQIYSPSGIPLSTNIIVFDFEAYQKELKNPNHSQNMLDAEKNNIRLMHIGELVTFIIPNSRQREIVLSNWKIIRDKAIADFLEQYPVIKRDLKSNELQEAERHFEEADKKYVLEHYVDSIRDIGIALEILLKIMLFIKEGREPRKVPTLDYLINQLQYPIADESFFGENVIHDLRYITRLRNKASHDSEDTIPVNKNTAFQAIQRAKLFFQLFQEFIATL